jgi:hypothetical protein
VSHWRDARPLSASQLEATAFTLSALAAELLAHHATKVQHNLATYADNGYPTHGDGGGNGGGPSSPVERQVNQPDNAADQARQLLADLRRLDAHCRRILGQLKAADPGRTIACYVVCGHPIDRAFTRCQVVEDGVQCGTSAATERRCANHTCDTPMATGDPLRDGRCEACYRFRRRTGRDRIVTAGLALTGGLLAEGTYSTSATNPIV